MVAPGGRRRWRRPFRRPGSECRAFRIAVDVAVRRDVPVGVEELERRELLAWRFDARLNVGGQLERDHRHLALLQRREAGDHADGLEVERADRQAKVTADQDQEAVLGELVAARLATDGTAVAGGRLVAHVLGHEDHAEGEPHDRAGRRALDRAGAGEHRPGRGCVDRVLVLQILVPVLGIGLERPVFVAERVAVGDGLQPRQNAELDRGDHRAALRGARSRPGSRLRGRSPRSCGPRQALESSFARALGAVAGSMAARWSAPDLSSSMRAFSASRSAASRRRASRSCCLPYATVRFLCFATASSRALRRRAARHRD
jgi:hypothetical protein